MFYQLSVHMLPSTVFSSLTNSAGVLLVYGTVLMAALIYDSTLLRYISFSRLN
jgi:hypothetical protein